MPSIHIISIPSGKVETLQEPIECNCCGDKFRPEQHEDKEYCRKCLLDGLGD